MKNNYSRKRRLASATLDSKSCTILNSKNQMLSVMKWNQNFSISPSLIMGQNLDPKHFSMSFDIFGSFTWLWFQKKPGNTQYKPEYFTHDFLLKFYILKNDHFITQIFCVNFVQIERYSILAITFWQYFQKKIWFLSKMATNIIPDYVTTNGVNLKKPSITSVLRSS